MERSTSRFNAPLRVRPSTRISAESAMPSLILPRAFAAWRAIGDSGIEESTKRMNTERVLRIDAIRLSISI